MTQLRHYRELPLVYSCSGCSSAAQAANYIALKLDRAGVAEMSCISGVGGNVLQLVSLARSGRPILALDGCPLACTRACLCERGIAPNHHVLLHAMGVKKRYHADFDRLQADRIADELMQQVRSMMAEGNQP